MAITLRDGKFACSICGKAFASSAHADGCRDSHQMMYIPMTKNELNRLLNALVLDQVELVPSHLIDTLRKYAQHQAIKNGTQS